MSAERFTLDTNILVYSIDSEAGIRQRLAQDVIDLALQQDCHLTLQAVSEFYAAATRKRRMPGREAAAQASDWLELFPSIAASPTSIRRALAASAQGLASYWDALLLATAAEAGCVVALTEDLADGMTVEGVRIINPFGSEALTAEALRLLKQQ